VFAALAAAIALAPAAAGCACAQSADSAQSSDSAPAADTAAAQAMGAAPKAAAAAPPQGLARWLNPATAPFIPIPEIDVDPNSGTTVGVIPTILVTDEHREIRKIIAPVVDYSRYFGVGVGGSIYSFLSDETQWSVVAGAKQRVESQFDFEYLTGRLHDTRWSFAGSLVYERTGTDRFYGIGNDSPAYDVSNYTLNQKFVQTTVGWNLSHVLQIAYTLRLRDVQVQPGSLVGIPSIQSLYPALLGVGTVHENLSRIAVIYDTRDDVTVPTRGGQYVIYGGVAASDGVLESSLYSATGADARQVWSPSPGNIIAAHMALRYMPGVTDVPFWSLSNIGGDRSVLAEIQPLRGFGVGRFYSRNLFSTSVEYRKRVLAIDAVSTHINVELTPFVEVGEVFAHSRESPVAHLHKVGGLGFRGVASPFVVGYLDIGYGSDGTAVFTGINYPF